MSAAGSGLLSSRGRSISTSAPILFRTSKNPILEGLIETRSNTRSDPGTSAAAVANTAPEEESPGTTISNGLKGPGVNPTVRPRAESETTIAAPIAAKSRSVWSRVGIGSTTVVGELARSPARRTADFT